MKSVYSILSSILFGALLLNCAGARGEVKFDELKHPASMSGVIRTNAGTVLKLGKDLEVVGKHEEEKWYWGIFYTLIPLTGDHDFSPAMNQALADLNGDGFVNVSVQAADCGINQVIILNWLPIWPGCVITTVGADIIRKK